MGKSRTEPRQKRVTDLSPSATAKLGEMERDTKELLIGSGAIILFGVALIVWPSFADFVDHFAFSYLRDLINLLRGM